MFYGSGKSTDFSKPGVGFNWKKNAFGVTVYNNTGGTLHKGDVVALKPTGTSGQEWKAIIPATNAVESYLAVVIDTTIENAAIGKVLTYGQVDECRVLGHASIAANVFLECINRIAFDGTETNLAFVAGSGSTRDTITDSDSGLATDGFLAGMRIVIAGATTSGNDGSHLIYSVAAGTITLDSIGQVTSEAGASGMTMKTQGFFRYDATSESVNSPAVAGEAYTTTTAVALKKVFLTGIRKVIAAS